MAISLPGKNFQDVLPNGKNIIKLFHLHFPVNNVAGLLALAQCYQVDLVRDKCEHHLKFCHEMPAGERLILAKKYGLKDLMVCELVAKINSINFSLSIQYQIIHEQKTLEDKDKLLFALLEELF